MKAASLTICLCCLLPFASMAQPSACGPIVENFDNTGNSMAGFSSSTQASASPGFSFGATGADGYLERCNVPGPDSVYEIATPTFQSLASQTNLGAGFELSGDIAVADVNFFLEYVNTGTGTLGTSWVATAIPSYSSGTAQVCISIPMSSVPGFAAGGTYRFHIYLRPASGSPDCIIFDDFRTTGAPSQATLPVNFTGFWAKKAGNAVELTWTVAGEEQVSYYQVERSSNGRDFVSVAQVAAEGSSSYSFTDKNPGTGVVFYRVRNMDLDGQFRYTRIVRVNLSRVIVLTAYPQPFTRQLTIEHGSADNGRITISAATGRMVRSIPVNQDSNQTTVNTAGLAPGLYIIRFDNGLGGTETLKVIKQ